MQNTKYKNKAFRVCFTFGVLCFLYAGMFIYLTSRSFISHQYYTILNITGVLQPIFAIVQLVIIALGFDIISESKNNFISGQAINHILTVKKCSWCLLFSCISSTALFGIIMRSLLVDTIYYKTSLGYALYTIRLLYILFVIVWMLSTFLQVLFSYRNVEKLDYALTKNVQIRIKEVWKVILCSLLGLVAIYISYATCWGGMFGYEDSLKWVYLFTIFATIGLLTTFYLPTILYKKTCKNVKIRTNLFINTLIQALSITMLSDTIYLIVRETASADLSIIEYDIEHAFLSGILNYIIFLSAILLLFAMYRMVSVKWSLRYKNK